MSLKDEARPGGCSFPPYKTFLPLLQGRPSGEGMKGAGGFIKVLRTKMRGQRWAWGRPAGRGPESLHYDSQSLSPTATREVPRLEEGGGHAGPEG